MKKLMFIAAAALCGSLFADAITSANVVGYVNNTLRYGAKGVGATFVPVNGDTQINLQDIKIGGFTKVPGETGIGECYMQVLTSSGTSTKEETYYWFDTEIDVGAEDPLVLKGWYYVDDDTGEAVEIGHDVLFNPGDGVWVTAPDETYQIVSDGQVSAQDIPTTLRYGAKMICNATSATVYLNGGTKDAWTGVWVNGFTQVPGETGIGECYAQVLTSSGTSTKEETYYWFDAEIDIGAEDPLVLYGWYYVDDDTGEAVEIDHPVPIAAGESLWVTAPDTTYVINFPSAL